MAKKNRFFKEFLKEKKGVGAVSPSSRFLAKKMLAPINFETADVVVELGPGTGVFTKVMLKRLKAGARLLAFETNEQFCESISKIITDDRLILINDSAEKIEDYLKEHNIKSADYVVSSLPLAVIPLPVKNRIIKQSIDCLNKDGMYIQFQYSLHSHKLLKRKFSEVKIDFTPINIPPAFVYKCKV
jgi:phosphatidylethanolamine/phosphatidyl-N-methylethanolamine N-methyltransferase